MKLDREKLRFALQRELYQRSYYDFFIKAVTILEPSVNWRFNFHHKYLCDILQGEVERIAAGVHRDKDYVINMPPRTTKSLLFTVILNAWAWTKYPHLKFMTISYGEPLAVRLAYQTKLIITNPWYEEQWGSVYSLSKDDTQKGSYTNTKGGSRVSFGMSGGITGSGADIIVIDDANKPKDISDVMLSNVTDIFKDTVYNRLNDPDIGSRFVVQQRTHERDLSGFIMENYAEDFNHIVLPMELSDKVKPAHLALEYHDGLLHVDRFDAAMIASYKKVLGGRNYSGQYKQTPADEESSILKRKWFDIKIYDKEKHDNLTYHMFIDSAYTEKAKNDPTGILITAKIDNEIVISKAFKFYMEFPDLVKKIIELHGLYCSNMSKIYIEPKASGLSIIQQLKRITKFNIITMSAPKDSKIVRANAASPTVESGRIGLLQDSWNEDFLDEVASFPVAAHDEYVDCLGYAIDELLNKQVKFNYSF